jgi:hypothetical protein
MFSKDSARSDHGPIVREIGVSHHTLCWKKKHKTPTAGQHAPTCLLTGLAIFDLGHGATLVRLERHSIEVDDTVGLFT